MEIDTNSTYFIEIKNSINFLSNLEFYSNSNFLKKREFIEFISKRLNYSSYFEKLLITVLKESKKRNLIKLTNVLTDNLNDELGVVDNKINLKLVHSYWRCNFLESLKIKTLKNDFFLSEFKKFENLDFYELLGVILYHEGTIPYEFNKIKIMRDKYFPNLEKKAKLYLDDHISHDAQDHYPKLINSIENLNLNTTNKSKVLDGIRLMKRLRGDFYISLKTNF